MSVVMFYILVFLLHFIATAWFYLSGTTATSLNYLYNVTCTIFLLLPILHSIAYYRPYPSLRGVLTPLIVCNLLFAIAFYIWFGYNISGVAIPYPSLADVFFLLYYPANMFALYAISRVTKMRWKLSTLILTLVLTFLFSGISLTFLSSQALDFSAPFPTIFLNLAYPICDSILAAMGISILRNQKTVGYRYLFLYVFGYVLIGLSDTLFSYQTSLNIYWNGNVIDLVYTLAYALIGLGTYFLPTLANTTSTESV